MIDTDFALRRSDAIRGSEALRNAILSAQGKARVPPPVRIRKRPMRPRATVRTPRVPETETTPVLCSTCGAPTKPMPNSIAHIQATVAAYYKLPATAMVSARQARFLSHPRQIAMYLAAELTHKSLPAIGRQFARDHTTVIYALKAVRSRIANDAGIAADVAILRERLTA